MSGMSNTQVNSYVVLRMLCFHLLERMDDLEGTDLYRHKLKYTCTEFKKEIEKLSATHGFISECLDKDKLFAAMQGIENISKEVAKLSVADMIAIGVEGINFKYDMDASLKIEQNG